MPTTPVDRIERVLVSIASPLMQPSPNGRKVGIRIVTFEACSGFTHATARRIAQPSKATLVSDQSRVRQKTHGNTENLLLPFGDFRIVAQGDH